MANTNLRPTAGDLNLSVNNPRLAIPVAVLSLVGNLPNFVSGNPTVLEGLSGTLTITGVTVARITATLSTPLVGTLTITGNPPSFNYPATGALTLTGVAGSLLPGTAFIPPQGFLTLSLGGTSQPTTGTLALTGATPSLQTGPLSPSFSPAAGSLVLTGSVANLVSGVGSVALSPLTGQLLFGEPVYFSQPGSLTLTGAAVSLLENSIRRPLTSGSLTLAGAAGSILVNRPLTTLVGTLTLTGQQAVITALQLIPATATLVLTGSAGNASRSIVPLTGTLILEGQASEFPGVSQKSPSTATLTLTGVAPNVLLTLAVTLQPGTASGTLVLAGLAPSVQSGAVGIPAAGTLTLTGQASTIPGPTAMPSTGTLTTQGQAPLKAIDGPTDLTPPTGQLVLAGAVPGVQSLRLTRGYRFTARIRRGARVPRRAE